VRNSGELGTGGGGNPSANESLKHRPSGENEKTNQKTGGAFFAGKNQTRVTARRFRKHTNC
jgi:hypothetical protein